MLVQSKDVRDTDRWAGSADIFGCSDVSWRSEAAVGSKKPVIECFHASECRGEGGD